MMTSLSNKYYSGHCEASEEELTGKRDLEKMWTAVFKYIRMKMKAAAQDSAGWRPSWFCGLCSTGSDVSDVRHK